MTFIVAGLGSRGKGKKASRSRLQSCLTWQCNPQVSPHHLAGGTT